MPNREELAQLVAAKLSVEEILDILEWNTEEFVDNIINEVWDNKESFMEAIA